ETTRMLLDWSVYELARHPELHDAIREEYAALQEHPERLLRKTVLDTFVEKAMRLHPTFPLIPRRTEKDVELGGRRIPARTNVFVFLPALAEDPALGKNDPNTLTLTPTEQFRSVEDYHQFGTGKRRCPGWALAMTEAKMLIGELATSFSISVDPKSIRRAS